MMYKGAKIEKEKKKKNVLSPRVLQNVYYTVSVYRFPSEGWSTCTRLWYIILYRAPSLSRTDEITVGRQAVYISENTVVIAY